MARTSTTPPTEAARSFSLHSRTSTHCWLLENDVDRSDNNGATPHQDDACENGQVLVARFLIEEYGADETLVSRACQQ